MKFNIRLKQLREEHGLLQKELAEKINVTRSAVTAYENGKREPDLEKLITIWDSFKNETDVLKKREILKIIIQKIVIKKSGEVEFYLSDL